MSKFRSQERLTSRSLMEEVLLIEEIMNEPIDKSIEKKKVQHHIRLAQEKDIPQLIALYKEIFETYPSPLNHTSYFESIFQKNSIFAVCEIDGKIAAAASAEARGLGIMTQILRFLEQELIKRKYICSYTMARSRSFGMNNVFYRMDYEFLGRLVNSCDICGSYENMNIWVRDLR